MDTWDFFQLQYFSLTDYTAVLDKLPEVELPCQRINQLIILINTAIALLFFFISRSSLYIGDINHCQWHELQAFYFSL